MKNLMTAKNVEYLGKEVYPVTGSELKLNTAKLVDLNTERWNTLAEKTNTKSFIRMTGKQPEGYAEVKKWMSNLIQDAKKAPAVTGADSVHAFA